MITDKDKSILRALTTSPQWATVRLVAEEHIKELWAEYTVFDTEWETIRATIEKEAKVRAVKRFLQELDRQSV